MGSTAALRRGRRRFAGVLIATGTVLLTACSTGGGDDAAEDAGEPLSSVVPAAAPLESTGTADETDAADADGVERPEGGDIDLGQIGRDVVVEMYVTIGSDDVRRSVAAVSARASGLGGGVASSQVDYGSSAEEPSGRGYALIVVKVPPDAVDDLLGGLEQTGTIVSIEQSARDVTEQLVDLDVRIANARQSVQNVRAFMERATDLQELVALESELTRRQTELERLEAQQRNLGDRVALATVTVEIIPTALAPDQPDDDSIADAFGRGWDGFVAVVLGIGFAVAIALPFLLLGGLLAIAAWWAVRRSQRSRIAPAPTTPTAPPDDRSDDELVTVGGDDATRRD
jgi:hypothetical protein